MSGVVVLSCDEDLQKQAREKLVGSRLIWQSKTAALETGNERTERCASLSQPFCGIADRVGAWALTITMSH